MTWLEQHDQSYYTLSVSNASGHFEFDWVVGFAGSGHAMYSVSDEAALIVSEHGPTTMWVAYELEADARIISSQSAIPWGGYFNCSFCFGTVLLACACLHAIAAGSFGWRQGLITMLWAGMYRTPQTRRCGRSCLAAQALW